VQIIQRQLDKLSAPCTFCTGAYRDIFIPRPELFSSLYNIQHSSTLAERSNEEEALRSALRIK